MTTTRKTGRVTLDKPCCILGAPRSSGARLYVAEEMKMPKRRPITTMNSTKATVSQRRISAAGAHCCEPGVEEDLLLHQSHNGDLLVLRDGEERE